MCPVGNLIELIDPICDRFEAAWLDHVNLGTAPPCPDEFIPEGFAGVAELIIKLLEVDLEYCAAHDRPSVLRAQTICRVLRTQGERFTKITELGKGGMGSVHVAEDREFGRRVALKEISAELKDQPIAQHRFLREALITGKLEHPNIVPIYGFGIGASKVLTYAMRLLSGKTLASEIDELHRLPVGSNRVQRLRKLLHGFITVCNAVGFAHSQGIIHRDLKPLNIILDDFDQIYVIDWGLAKIASETVAIETEGAIVERTGSLPDETTFGTFIGSKPYASPEQIKDSASVGPAADIYSLGATLYHLLRGQAPVPTDEFKPAPDAWSGAHYAKVPRELQAICVRALAANPEARYATVLDLAADIGRYLEDASVSACPEHAAARMRRWLKRRVTSVVAASAAMLVGLIAYVIASELISRERLAAHQAKHELVENELRQALEHEKQEQLQLKAEEDWFHSLNNQVFHVQDIFLRKDVPGAEWDYLVLVDAWSQLREVQAKLSQSDVNAKAKYQLAKHQLRLAYMIGACGDAKEALRVMESTIPLLESLLPAWETSGWDESQEDLSLDYDSLLVAKNNHAVLLVRLGDTQGAVTAFRRLLDWINSTDPLLKSGLGSSRANQVESNLAMALRGIDGAESERRLASAYSRQTELRVKLAQGPGVPDYIEIALGLQYAHLLVEQKRPKRAGAVLKEIHECITTLWFSDLFATELGDAFQLVREARAQLEQMTFEGIYNRLRLAGKACESARRRRTEDRFDERFLLGQLWFLP